MPNALQMAGATAEPSNFVPLHTNRIFTGLWTNRSPMRDAATSDFQEHYGMGRQDSILAGQNSEITPRLTLARRPGSSIYSDNGIPPVKRFYSFNTFTITTEVIRVMADTANAVYDYTVVNPADPDPARLIFTKSAGAGPTFFLGVGNTLYMTNGVDNKQVTYDPTTDTWGEVIDWGIDAPTTAPTVTQAPRVSPYPTWQPSVFYGWPLTLGTTNYQFTIIVDTNNVLHITEGGGVTGPGPDPPAFNPGGSTQDGTIEWNPVYNPTAWQAGYAYAAGQSAIVATVSGMPNTFLCISGSGNSAAQPPVWPASGQVQDGPFVWQNIGITAVWNNPAPNQPSIGPNRTISSTAIILDPNGYIQKIIQPGVSNTQPPNPWQEEAGAFTNDGTAAWINTAPYSVGATAPTQYGYAYENSSTDDISNMSPASVQITVIEGNQVTITGDGTGQAGIDIIPLYRTPQGGSTFLYMDQIPNPGAGKKWTYVDNIPDADLNTEIQAQVAGEGTPLPAGATCLGYHLTRIFAAVGNVVWVSSGPDAVASGSSGNAGFDTAITAQSKIIRFWACSLGMVVFTVRDAYIILGSATDADPLYMVVFIEDLPLKSYDCWAVNKTTPYMLLGNNQLVSLDPSAGIIEVGFPIADRLMEEYDPTASYLTYHSQSSLDTALYIANGSMAPNPAGFGPPVPAPGQWYRMAQNNAPEQGSAWSTKALVSAAGCVQSVEVYPGTYRLLIAPTTASAVLQRDRSKNTDNGTTYPVQTVFGSIVLAQPGQLAALSFITLESMRVGTRAGLALLLGEIFGEFETLNRTHQDPPILPPSNSLYSDRYNFAQSQNEAWCRHFQMEITWPAEDAANELLTFTIFGQTWQEMRSQ